ncbi:MAG: nucleotidyltransferase family protein [Tomitella sp.]|nr:nucleotidyltransferase family protein [Tomitella sp.]
MVASAYADEVAVPTPAILLAAGRGRRFGLPKALVEIDGESLPARAVRTLTEGGCGPVIVVLGARAEQAAALLPDLKTGGPLVVVAQDWEEGVSASLRAGLEAASTLDPPPDAALIHLVDLPDIGPEVVTRILAARTPASSAPRALARAAFHGVPGHPVLLGSDHWQDVIDTVHGDRGAGPWLRARDDVESIECGDLATGIDVDTPDALRRRGLIT